MQESILQASEMIKEYLFKITMLKEEMARILVGQNAFVERLFIALLCDGHVLVEGVPGLAKTTAIKTLAQSMNAVFSRIQFTPDLLPADILGTQIYNPATASFSVKKGPVFAQLVLADEINRAPAKVQSALLEVMQERQVTLGGQTFKLEEPFLVMATQNPLEQQGTYPLPEAQLDRFLFKILVDYPEESEELEIMNRALTAERLEVRPVLQPADILRMRDVVHKIYVDEKVKRYILALVRCSREPMLFGLENLKRFIALGASPRASIYLAQAAKAYAFLQGRAFVTPHDVKSIAPDILRHRVILSWEAEAEELTPDSVVRKILDAVPVP